MGVFLSAILLEISLVSRIAKSRINIKNDVNRKLMLISIILMIFIYSLNDNTFFLYYFLIPILVYIFYMDRKTYLIINEFNILLLILGLVYMVFSNQLFPHIFISLGFFIIMFLAILLEKIIKKEIIGDGDLKLFIVMSLLFSYKIFIVILIASIIALLYYYLKRLFRKQDSLIPFGPYLVIGFIIVIICM